MLRTFTTHKIRETQELSGRLWDFTLLDGEHAGETQKVLVPSCLETYPGLGNYRGWSAYETDFEAEGNVRLEFKGVSHFAKVLVDDKEVAQHYGSYTPFSVCITDLAPGIHHLKVLVDNAFKEDYALDVPNDYMSYGGISRGVVLEKISGCFLNYVHVTPVKEENSAWIVSMEISCANITGEAKTAAVDVELAGTKIQDQERTLNPGENVWTLENISIPGAKTWNMETPVLYTILAVLTENGTPVDDWMDRTGFRTVSIEGKKLFINGKQIRIKGFCRHEDHPQYGCALPASAMAYDLQLVKDMGGNSVRTTHYPNDELFLDLCDEMGILVWEENHARGFVTEEMKRPHFEEQCEDTIREMIRAHYNHPSIYIWGILNECGSDSEFGRACYDAQFQLIRKMDQSRPCTYASCRFNVDICQDLPDVCSWNIYPYWYEEKTSCQMMQEIWDYQEKLGHGREKPFLISEIGAGGIYAFRDQSKDVWSEDLQAEILGNQIKEVLNTEECIGMYIWQFCDVRVARVWWAIRRPKSRNNKGIVDEYRRPKMAYHVVKELYSQYGDYK